jgi:protein-S-isoprenylcysteine O-methyltransferase Ste14
VSFKNKLNWGRLIWTLLLCWYFINFANNFLNSLNAEKAQIPFVFFNLLIIWMGIEYYFGSPYFQSGTVILPGILKILFAIFFYSVTVYSIADYVTLNMTQLKALYPYVNIIGLVLFALGIIIRIWTLFELIFFFNNSHTANIFRYFNMGNLKIARHPRYLGTLLQTIAIPMLFSSYLGFILTVLIGPYLICLEIETEEKLILQKQAFLSKNKNQKL